jgi:IS30 family transposase
MSDRKEFSVATDVRVYFCAPHSLWQRGSNENTSGLLRQYFPKGADLTGYSQAQLDRIAPKLNLRPPETLGFEIPAHKLICLYSADRLKPPAGIIRSLSEARRRGVATQAE